MIDFIPTTLPNPPINIDNRYLENTYYFHLSLLEKEGISNYNEWLRRCGEFSPSLKLKAEKLYSHLITAKKLYLSGAGTLDTYCDIIQDWTIFCLETNDKLKTVKWI